MFLKKAIFLKGDFMTFAGELKWKKLVSTLSVALFAVSLLPPRLSLAVNKQALAGQEKIVFTSDRGGNGEIYTMNLDGSGLTQLTFNPGDNGGAAWRDDGGPAISPDGSKIAFTSTRDGNYEIYVMNADGTGQVRLTNNPAADHYPAWSPDGTKIAFHSYRDGNAEVYVMNADGTDQTNLSNNPADDGGPTWSPDGTKIAFGSNRNGRSDIYVMNPDGTDQTNLTNSPGVDDDYPAWSHDGTKIAWASGLDQAGYREIYSMNADGTDQTRLTNNQGINYDPAWSPDSNKITFVSNQVGNYEIYVMNADGSGQAQLTNNLALDGHPDWGILKTPAPIAPPAGMTHWWTGDGNVNDIIGGRSAVLQNGAGFAPGMVAQAFSLDGVDDFVSVPDDPSLNFGTRDFTVDLWVKFNDPNTGEQIIAEKYIETYEQVTGVPRKGWTLTKTVDNKIDLAGPLPSGMPTLVEVTPPEILANSWIHIAITRNGNDFTIFWNGTPLGTGTAAVDLDSTSSLKFGHRGNPDDTPGSVDTRGFYLNGGIDEVEIFGRALSAEEIQAIYNAGSAGKIKTPVTQVQIDIKPGSFPNSINPGSRGKIPVAILTTDTFDANTVDPATVRFGRTGTEVTPVHHALEDVDGDGDLDMILQFNTQDTGIVSSETTATLTGETFAHQKIEGSDSINTVGRK